MSSPIASAVAPRSRTSALSPTHLLCLMVGVGAVAHLALALQRVSPRYLPDEFLYGQLARSLGSGEGVSILGEPSSFPALLEPLLTAALWRSGDVELAYHSVQALHAVLMSLAAVPVFALARRLQLSDRAALSASALVLVSPGTLYVGYATADALGLLLALIALDAGVRALARPSRAGEAVFLVAAALATFARLQYVVLVPAFAVAALVVERGHLRAALRRVPLVAAALSVGAVALVVLPGALGRYENVASFGVSSETGRWGLSNLFLVAIAAGAALVPAAAVWTGLRIVRPSSPERTAFAAFAVAAVLALIAASALMAVETESNRFFERYLLLAAPCVALAFAAWAAESRPSARVVALLATALLAVVAALPLSGYAAGQGRADSPLLLAVGRLAETAGTANASLSTAALVSASLLLAIAVALVPRLPAWTALAATAAAFVVVGVGSHLADWRGSDTFTTRVFTGRPDWVQATGARDVLLVQTPWSGRLNAMITSLWNPGITDVTSVGEDIDPLDGLGEAARLRPDGALVEGGVLVERPVLFASYGTTVAFDESATTVRDRLFTLAVADGAPRLSSFAGGMRSDGTTAARGRLIAFPSPAGACRTLRVSAGVLPGLPPVTVALRRSGSAPQTVVIRPGAPVELAVSSTTAASGALDFIVTRVGSQTVKPSPLLEVLDHGPVRTTTGPCGAAART